MPGKTIGKTMPHGWAGSYARQPDMIVDTHSLGGDAPIYFGEPVVYDGAGNAAPVSESTVAADFVGVAVKEIKGAVSVNQGGGRYEPGEAVSVIKRGCVNVLCRVGTPALGGKVYLRLKANAAVPTGIVGGFEAQADGSNTIELLNCQWRGGADAEQVAELRILTLNRA